MSIDIDYLQHAGKKGMKWRKGRKTAPKPYSETTPEEREAIRRQGLKNRLRYNKEQAAKILKTVMSSSKGANAARKAVRKPGTPAFAGKKIKRKKKV